MGERVIGEVGKSVKREILIGGPKCGIGRPNKIINGIQGDGVNVVSATDL